MSEVQPIDVPNSLESSKLDFTDLTRSWLAREAKKQLNYTRTHPPLLSGDQLSIDGKDWTVSLINDATLYTEWSESETPRIHMLSDFGFNYTPSRAVAVVYPENNKKQTHYLSFGRKAIGKKKQYEPSFQLIPVDDQTRATMVDRPEADLITKFFVRGREPTMLETDTEWLPEVPVRPTTGIMVTHKTQIPESEITAFTILRVAATERDRMYKVWKKAWKYFPGAAFLGGMTAMVTSGGSEAVPTFSGMISGSAVGLSTVLFQKTLEHLNRDLNNVISEQQNRPVIRKLARLKFEKPRS